MTVISVLQPMRVIVITDLSDKQSETSDLWLEREREKGRCEVVEVFLSFYDGMRECGVSEGDSWRRSEKVI